LSISHKVSENNIITGGFDLKQGSVDAADVYYSSTDKINNKGKMNFLAVFVQDEHQILKDKLKFIAGLRMDYAKYFDGAFTIDYPSEANNYLNIYQIQSIPDADFNALSPKFSLLYKLSNNTKIYASYAIGFRPPTLDDMCRSGKIKGGFKVVNPYLKPEYLTNYEIGLTINYRKWQFTPSLYYSLGKDFMYYVNTGDSVNQGFKVSPVFQSRNISKVEIYGFETGLNYTFNDKISAFASYAYSHSQIKEYKILNPLKDVDLTDKYLTDVPDHSASLGVFWNSKIVNLAVFAKYVGKKWVNDSNIADDKYGLDAQYPDYILFNLNLRRQILSFADARLSVENIFDKMIYDSKNLRGTGRFITLGINFKF
jgi:iron complex outermembrane receptor protein